MDEWLGFVAEHIDGLVADMERAAKICLPDDVAMIRDERLRIQTMFASYTKPGNGK